MTLACLRRWLVGALVVVVGVGLWGTVPAAAHGDPEFSGDVGPFAVETFDEQISETDLLYTVIVNDPTTGLPIRGATVEVSANTAARRIGPLVGNELGGAYQVLLPDPVDEAWHITVRIALADDTVTFSHELGVGATEGRRAWRNALIATPAVVAVFAALGLAWAARRKARAAWPPGS